MILTTNHLKLVCLSITIGLLCCPSQVFGQAEDSRTVDSASDGRSKFLGTLLTTPQETPAPNTTLLRYTGVPIAIRWDGGEPRVVERPPTLSRRGVAGESKVRAEFQHRTDEEGFIDPQILPSNCKHVLAYGETGIVLKDSKDFQPSHSIQLKPWETYRSRVELNGTPLKSGTVIARWESFPHHSSILSLPATTLQDGPPLFSFEAATAVVGGQFNFPKLPEGDIRFMVLPDLQPDDSRIWQSSSNLTWWDNPAALRSEKLLTAGRQFNTFTVTGQIKPTDELEARRVSSATAHYKTPPKTLDLAVIFQPAFESPESNSGKLISSGSQQLGLEQAIIRAKNWGSERRAPGYRDKFRPAAVALLDSKNGFAVTLRNHRYNFASLWIEQEHFEDSFTPLGSEGVFFEIDPEVAARRGGDINLGVIDLTDKITPKRSESVSRNPPRRDFPTDSDFDDMQPVDTGRETNGLQLPRQPKSMLSDDIDSQQWNPTSDDDEVQDLIEEISGPRPAGQNSLRMQIPVASPVDKAIAELVTGLLSAGDARTRANLKKPLQTLLEQKFDAEQQARESIVGELQKRLKNAEQKVQERAANKAAIVQQQLQRMMGLPEDGFLEMSPVENDRPFEESTSNSDAELALNHLSQFTYPVPFQCDFTTVDQGGTPLRFLDYNGQTRLVYFWSLSDTSKLQLPALVKLQSKYEKYGFQIIGLHTSSSNDPSANHQLLREAIATAKINFPLGLTADATQQQVPGVYPNPEPPELLFIDNNNKVRLKVNGVKSDEYLAEVVEALLKEATIERSKKGDPLRGRDPLRR